MTAPLADALYKKWKKIARLYLMQKSWNFCLFTYPLEMVQYIQFMGIIVRNNLGGIIRVLANNIALYNKNVYCWAKIMRTIIYVANGKMIEALQRKLFALSLSSLCVVVYIYTQCQGCLMQRPVKPSSTY